MWRILLLLPFASPQLVPSSAELLVLQDLALSSDCIQQKLSPILDECVGGIDSLPQNRLINTAIQLSVCQFEATGIAYPDICNEAFSQSRCLEMLDSRPQWWTTYYVTYQSLQQLCHQRSTPHAKEQILALYANITHRFRDFNSLVMDIISSAGDNFESVSQRFDQLESVMRRLGHATEQQLDALDAKLDQSLAKSDALSESLGETESTIDEVNEFLGSLQHTIALAVDQALNETKTHTSSLVARQLEMAQSLEASQGVFEDFLRESVEYLRVSLRDQVTGVNSDIQKMISAGNAAQLKRLETLQSELSRGKWSVEPYIRYVSSIVVGLVFLHFEVSLQVLQLSVQILAGSMAGDHTSRLAIGQLERATLLAVSTVAFVVIWLHTRQKWTTLVFVCVVTAIVSGDRYR